MIACLDLEGVLVPEIWINVAERTGIPELRRTTRDEPDYDKLMRARTTILGLTVAFEDKCAGASHAFHYDEGIRAYLEKLLATGQRTRLRVTIEDAAATDATIQKLMGREVAPRFQLIMERAIGIADLDV